MMEELELAPLGVEQVAEFRYELQRGVSGRIREGVRPLFRTGYSDGGHRPFAERCGSGRLCRPAERRSHRAVPW